MVDVKNCSREEYFNLSILEYDGLSTGDKFILFKRFGEFRDFTVSIGELIDRYGLDVDGLSDGVLGLRFKDYFTRGWVTDFKVVFSDDGGDFRVSLNFRNLDRFVVFSDVRGVYSGGGVWDVGGMVRSVP